MSMLFDATQFVLQYARFCNCSSSECRCEENNAHEWTWDKDHASCAVDLSEDNLEVKFHNGYSCGTAVVRGDKPLEKERHHYWEVKMVTPIYGTDIMIGVGTNKVQLNSMKNCFCSFLGRDQESFGYSYLGYIQHSGETRNYGSCFGQGSLVGMHLDTWRGTLEFYLNRKPLGVAFTGLQNIQLYPMVCSTAAKSKMRLTYSCSLPVSLQIECLAALRPSDRTYLSTTFPSLHYLSKSIFAKILQRQSNDTDEEKDEYKYMAECLIVKTKSPKVTSPVHWRYIGSKHKHV